jgi:polyisoprenoid-binding protein YceI
MSEFPTELTGTWAIDPHHTVIGFTTKHAMVTTVRGSFGSFTGSASIDAENPENSTATLDIDVASVTTGSPDRDNHLRSPDFFDAENHPTMTFRSTGAKVDGEAVVLTGDLMIKGVTRTADIAFEFGGLATDPFGNRRAGFEGSGSLSRKDFGLTWNAALETGGVLVSDKIKLVLDVSAIKQPA